MLSQGTAAGHYNSSNEDIQLNLIFSPFEELPLRTAGIMGLKGIHRVYELTCLCRKGSGPQQQSSSHSILSGWKCNLNYSTLYSSLQKDAFKCCFANCANFAEGQPCLQDQHLVVEPCTAPALRGRPLCGQN